MKSNAKCYRKTIAVIGIVLLTAGVTRTSKAEQFTKIDVPGALGVTEPSGINAQGDIVGTYFTIVGAFLSTRGFLLSKGTFTNIDVDLPYAVPGSTNAIGINTGGDIVGFYASNDNTIEKGFLLSNGRFTAIQAPEPTSMGSSLTVTTGVDPQDDIIGVYFGSNFTNEQSFLLSR